MAGGIGRRTCPSELPTVVCKPLMKAEADSRTSFATASPYTALFAPFVSSGK